MSDLIEKFFREDLSEAERLALREELLASPGLADRFGARAEEVYRSLGLPEPLWTGPDHFKPLRKTRFWKWFGLGVLFMGGLGTLGWLWFRGNPISLVSISSPNLETTPVLNTSARHAKHLKPQKEMESASSARPLTMARVEPFDSKPDSSPATTVVSNPRTVSTLPALPAMSAMVPRFTPVNANQISDGSFSSLSVVLRRTTPGVVSVRVLDIRGTEILPLYNGTLPAGSWVFTWDGLLRNGLLAQPGEYGIEVRAGSWVQVKKVLIQK